MSATVKVALSTPATVRLTPSTAIEPFSATNLEIEAGSSMVTSLPLAAACTDLMAAVVSMWPWTRWPSRVSAAWSGSSRLTSLPAVSAPRLVRRLVSGTTSAKKTGPCFLTTVRQAPLTATLLPTFRCFVIQAWSMPIRSPRTSTTLEVALTIPVNISADQEIIAEPGHIHLVQRLCAVEPLDAETAQRAGRVMAADEPGSDVCVDLVDQVGFEQGGVHLRSAFDQNAEDVALAELVHQVLEADTSGFCGGQRQHLGEPDAAWLRRRDHCVGADDSC